MKRKRYLKLAKLRCDHCTKEKDDVNPREHCPIHKAKPYLCNDCYIKVIEKDKEGYADNVIYKLKHGRSINDD